MAKEKKYIIELSETQLRLIADCVEDCHRFAAGQTELHNTGAHWADMNPMATLDEEYAWKVYNFINNWKAGTYGKIPLQKSSSHRKGML